MEAYSTSNDDEGHSNSCKLHFFKIIVSPIIQLQKLRIPVAFVKKTGKLLLDYASLRTPEGEVWEVGLTKHKGEIHFDQGWQGFAEYHSLAFGHFLMFKYQGNSQFEVSIFDKSCSEIEYPNRSTKQTHETGGASNEIRRRLDHNIGSNEIRRRLDHNIGSNLRGVKNSAVERAKAFECKNPHFTILMQPSFLSYPFLVSIPISYSREHMKEENKFTIRLRTATKGKTWRVNCYFTTEPRVKIGAGWGKFVQGNQLRVGDVCLFELTHPGKKAYKVHIFRK